MNALFISEFKTCWRLAIPLITALVAEMGMQIINGIMMGYLGTDALAAGALAVSASILILVSSMGITISAGIYIAQAHGAQDHQKIINYWQHGIYLVILISIPIMLVEGHLYLFFQVFHQDPHVISLAQYYLWGELAAIPAVLGYVLFKEICTILERTLVLMLISIACLPLSALLNYAFIFGYWGFPKWGMFGIGISNTIICWLMLLIMVIYAYHHQLFKPIIHHAWQRLHYPTLLAILKTGIPIGTTIFFEAGLFLVSALMMGWISVTTLAAHQIAIQYVDLIFMFSLGATQVATIRVAKFYGANDLVAMQRTVKANILISSIIAGSWSVILLIGSTPLINLFIHSHGETDPLLFSTAKHFFFIAALFVYLDSLKLLGNNILRGINDTFIPMLLAVGAYWLIGLGSAYLLAFHFHLDGQGVWWGMTAGVVVVSILLWLRWRQQFAKLKIYSS